MKLINAITLMGLLSLLGNSAMAESPFSIRTEAGLSGYGGAVMYQVTPNVSLALGYNGGKLNWKDSVRIDNIDYNLDMNNDMTYLNAMIYPWGASDGTWLKSLYTTVGIGYVGNEYDLHRHFKPGDKRPPIINKYVPKNFSVDVKGYMDYPSTISPYIGFGLAPQINEHWGVFAEVGTYYMGNASIHLTHINNYYVNDLAVKTDYKLDDEVIFTWYPVAKIGLTYTF